MRKLTGILGLILSISRLQAQRPSAAEWEAIYSERIFIHTTDRFPAGDTIWFKAYVFSGNYPGTASTDLYIDLINTSGDIVGTKKLPITDATAAGDFSLTDSLDHGFYFLRAYTRALVREGNSNGVLKTVAIINPDKIPISYRSAHPNDFYVNFFVESGGLVKGLSNTIIFKATDVYGQGISAKGTVFSSSGDTIISFTDIGRGLGSFNLTPADNEKYFAEIHFKDGSSTRYDLPEAIPEGILLRVAENAKGKIFQVEKTEGFSAKTNLTLAGYMFNKIIFREPLKFDDNTANGLIPSNKLPEGVLNLAVIDDNGRVYARRPAFVYQPINNLAVSLKTDTLNLTPKGKNCFTLTFPDSTEGNFSVSVVDYDEQWGVLNNNNISSALFWDAEKETPLSLQTVETTSSDKQVRMLNDLALITEKQKSLREIGNVDDFDKENYIEISGDVFKSGTTKPVIKGDLIFLVQTKDSASAFLQAPVEKDGTFKLSNLVFDDMARFHYQLSGKNPLLVDIKLIDPGERFKIKNKMTSLPLLPHDRILMTDSTIVRKWAEEKNFLIQSARGKMLAEVVVSSKTKKPIEIVNKNYTMGLFTSMNSTVFDFVNDPPKPGSQRILEWLKGKVAGLTIESRNGTYVLTSTRAMSLTGGPIPVQIFLNEVPVEPDILLTLPVSEVALVKYFKAGSNMMAGFGISGKLAIYTKRPEEVDYGDVLHAKDFIYRGYSSVQSFTLKDEPGAKGEKDERTTLYWNPEASIASDNNEFKFLFYNSDKARKLKIVVQGFSYDGRLISFEKIIE